MKKVYLASGWFNENQEKRVAKAEEVLRGLGLAVFSPREHQNEHLVHGSKMWRKSTFNSDVNHIDWSDFIFAVYDEEDSGTMWEIGYAFKAGKPVLVYNESEKVVNLMITDSLDAYFTSWEEVEAYDFDELPGKEYSGDVE